jgi:hypothetical protein
MVAALAIATTLPALGQEASAGPDAASQAPDTPEGFNARMVRQVGEIIDSVHPIRGLAPATNVGYRVIDEATLAADLESLFREEYSDDYLAAEDAALTRLGLLKPDDDLRELYLSLYGSQVLAYYDPSSDTFSLLGPARTIDALDSVVVAHEYAHALQDAAYDLEGTRVKDLDRNDAMLAEQALVEGDATAVMYDWAARELKLSDLLAVSVEALTSQDGRALQRAPDLLRRQLEFPYIDGFAFVNALRGRGDWAAVDEAWRSRPVSTEQILHPELYPDERPIEITLPDVAARLGGGWTTSYQQTFGEMQIGVWVADGRKARSLFPVLPAQLPRAEAAAGWGGDRLVSLDGPDGAWAVVWQTAWDTRADAKEFIEAARDAVEDLPGAKAVSDEDVTGGLSSPGLVLVADSEATLDLVEGALGLSS